VKILHILDHSVPLQSGYAFRTRAILLQQRELGWETVQVTSAKHRAKGGLEEYVGGLRFYRTPGMARVTERLPLWNQLAIVRSLERRLEEIVERERPDLLHAHSPALNGMAALRVGRRRGLPMVYECRAFWEDAAVDHGSCREGGIRYRATRAMESYVFRRADGVTTICEGLRREICARGVPENRVAVVPNAVDLDVFRMREERDASLARELGVHGDIVLGFIGSFYAYEGLSLLLEALPRILKAEPNVRLVLVGGGREEMSLRKLAAALGVADRVVFTGRVPHEDVHRYYDLVDVFIYPRLAMRLTEIVTPLKPLEAMALGRVVLASDVGGHRELIADGETGRLFRAGDAASLAQAAVELIGERDTWQSYRRNARRFVEQTRSWSVSVARYESVYGAARARRSVHVGRASANPGLQ